MLENRREEAEEEGQLYDFRDPFQDSGAEEFAELSCRDQVQGILHRLITCSPDHLLTCPPAHLPLPQVRTLHHLTSLRLEAPDVPERLKDLDPDGE